VTAIVGMMFVVCIIVGSLLGSIVYEQMGHSGYIVILGYLALAACVSFFLDYDGITFRTLIEK
jgi:uncharacterized membrane protein